MKRPALAILALLLSAMLPGCTGVSVLSSAREPDNLELVRTIGVDMERDMVKVTVCSASGMNGSAEFFTGTAETFSKAINNIKKLPQGREAEFSHTEHVVISEEAALCGIDEILDYVERSDTMRIDTDILICRGVTAAELITSASGESSSVSDALTFLEENIDLLGSGYVFSCRDIASALSLHGCALIETIELAAAEEYSENEAEKSIVPAGFALFKEDNLIGYLSESQSNGAVLVMNKLKSEDIVLRYEDTPITVSVSEARTELTPDYLSGELSSIAVKTSISADITSVSGDIKITDEAVRRELEQSLAQEICKNVSDAVELSQALGVDFMDIGHKIEIISPLKYEENVENFTSCLKTVPFDITVSAKLERTFDITDPLPTDSGKELSLYWKIREK